MSQTRADALRQELEDLIANKSSTVLPLLRGQINWIAKTRSNHSFLPETWVLRAQEGTIEKFDTILAESHLQGAVELIALSRNIFENLIWLKLFNKDRHYGLVFYQQLLEQQLDSQKQAIEKANEEIALFNALKDEESPDFDAIKHLISKNEPSEEDGRAIRDYIKAHEAAVDAKVRATFSLYGEQAKTNGFAFQAHLIETKAIPHHRERIETLQRHLHELKASMPTDLPAAMQRELDEPVRWNWADRATSVGMQSHYKFLYKYTSRLLHSTPMNLITPKELDDAETCTLLDYLCVAVNEAYAEIERFTYPNKRNVIFVNVGE
ncbi:hypothetical protein [Noviherbaspirillum sp. UKPF54]|uniref:hypothetical protein n=1 Tax=Noviherbaspirillum sp. UKPF54 TaxID=2601898 RepID=UPI0011B0FB4A|nr:hypothetical protein [Noviherbaspirillum sp. UKPF54]QDZ29567.1 hypothetical protein FAY22_17325 [Noviherbaspirillum sp. UKPF54]